MQKKYMLVASMLLVAILAPTVWFITDPNSTHVEIIDKKIESSKVPTILFCPQDNCSNHLLTHIQEANNSVHCAFFDLKLTGIIEALKQKQQTLDVKIVTDEKYAKQIAEITQIKKDTSYGLMHNKFCIFDSKRIWTGSFNPTPRGDTKNNNNIVISNSKYLVHNYIEEFNELWNSEYGQGKKTKYTSITLTHNNSQETDIQNYFCPEDNCAQQVIRVLQKANKSIHFMTFSFTHERIGNELIKKHKQGVEIKGIFEKSQNNKWNEMPHLKEQEISVRWDTNPANMHHKVFIIDNHTVITGSMNPSKNGDERNDENIIIIKNSEIAKKYAEEFQRLWS